MPNLWYSLGVTRTDGRALFIVKPSATAYCVVGQSALHYGGPGVPAVRVTTTANHSGGRFDMSNEMSWEWIAGFTEGEGHIYWQKGKKGTKHGTCGRVIIGQKCKAPLRAIADFLLENGIENPRLYLRPASPRVERSCDIWILEIGKRADVIHFLECTIDLLFQKKEKGMFVLESLKHPDLKRGKRIACAGLHLETGFF